MIEKRECELSEQELERIVGGVGGSGLPFEDQQSWLARRRALLDGGVDGGEEVRRRWYRRCGTISPVRR